MPRITHVKRAQVRYPTVKVLDNDGNPVKVQVMRKDGVTPKLTRPKHGRPGRPIYMTRTVADRTADPLPPYQCDASPCKYQGTEGGRAILPGMAYKHITPRSGPYGGRQRNRHEECPNWQPWEYSGSLSARIGQVQHEAADLLDPSSWTEQSDAESARDEVAALVQELLDEKQGNLDNMPDGLRDASELNDQVDALEQWHSDVEGADLPDFPDTEEEDCGDCDGEGTVDCGTCDASGEDGAGDPCEDCDGEGTVDCANCEGTGTVEPEEPDQDAVAGWAQEAADAIQSAVDEVPL